MSYSLPLATHPDLYHRREVPQPKPLVVNNQAPAVRADQGATYVFYQQAPVLVQPQRVPTPPQQFMPHSQQLMGMTGPAMPRPIPQRPGTMGPGHGYGAGHYCSGQSTYYEGIPLEVPHEPREAGHANRREGYIRPNNGSQTDRTGRRSSQPSRLNPGRQTPHAQSGRTSPNQGSHSRTLAPDLWNTGDYYAASRGNSRPRTPESPQRRAITQRLAPRLSRAIDIASTLRHPVPKEPSLSKTLRETFNKKKADPNSTIYTLISAAQHLVAKAKIRLGLIQEHQKTDAPRNKRYLDVRALQLAVDETPDKSARHTAFATWNRDARQASTVGGPTIRKSNLEPLLDNLFVAAEFLPTENVDIHNQDHRSPQAKAFYGKQSQLATDATIAITEVHYPDPRDIAVCVAQTHISWMLIHTNVRDMEFIINNALKAAEITLEKRMHYALQKGAFTDYAGTERNLCEKHGLTCHDQDTPETIKNNLLHAYKEELNVLKSNDLQRTLTTEHNCEAFNGLAVLVKGLISVDKKLRDGRELTLDQAIESVARQLNHTKKITPLHQTLFQTAAAMMSTKTKSQESVHSEKLVNNYTTQTSHLLPLQTRQDVLFVHNLSQKPRDLEQTLSVNFGIQSGLITYERADIACRDYMAYQRAFMSRLKPLPEDYNVTRLLNIPKITISENAEDQERPILKLDLRGLNFQQKEKVYDHLRSQSINIDSTHADCRTLYPQTHLSEILTQYGVRDEQHQTLLLEPQGPITVML